jgi:hypothetical protein
MFVTFLGVCLQPVAPTNNAAAIAKVFTKFKDFIV